MAEHDLIDAYLVTLRRSVAKLPNAGDIVDEAADHLLSTVEALTASGVHRTEAERIALDRYGPARKVGRAFVEQARRRGAVPTEYTRRAGLYAIAAAALGFVPTGFADIHVEPPALLGVLLVVVVMAGGTWCSILAILGIRERHGTLGPWGRRAIALAVASPVVGLVFQSANALLAVLALALACVTVGLVRARILPAPAVVLWLFGWVPRAVARDMAGGHVWVEVASVAQLVGLAWIGWALWREQALDEQEPADSVTA